MSDIDFGDKQFTGVGFPTPVSVPDTFACRQIQIPASGDWQSLVMGALDALTHPENWQQFEGGISREDAAAAAQQMIDCVYEEAAAGCIDQNMQTPYWDDDADVGDEESRATQTWYGEVTNPDAPADELDFVENSIVWVMTGLLAIASAEIGFAPAILFHTLAPRFIIAMRTADVAEVFRIVVNGQDYARVDTTGHASGEIINQTIVIDEPTDDNVLLILTELA